MSSELLVQPGRRDLSPTELLAALFCEEFDKTSSRSDVSHVNVESTNSLYIGELHRLLEADADPDVLICEYFANNRRVYRLARAAYTPDFFQGSYRDFCSRSASLPARLDREWDWFNETSESARLHVESLYTPLVKAACESNLEAVSILTQYGARIDPLFKWTRRTGAYWTPNPFLPAVIRNNVDLLTLLLKAIEMPHSTFSRWLGECMTQFLDTDVATGSNWTIADLLVSHGANMSIARLPLSPTPEVIDYAVRQEIAIELLKNEGPEILMAAALNHMDLCKYVTGHGGDLAARSPLGLDVLQVASGNKDAELLGYFIAIGAKVRSVDYDGMSPLLEAVYYGHVEAVEILAARGASPNDKISYEITTPLQGGYVESIRLRGTWRDRRDVAVILFKGKAWSALHIAAHRGLSKMISVLHSLGARNDVKDRDGCTPLDIAIRNSSMPMKSWLHVCELLSTPDNNITSGLLGNEKFAHIVGIKRHSELSKPDCLVSEDEKLRLLLCHKDLPADRASDLDQYIADRQQDKATPMCAIYVDIDISTRPRVPTSNTASYDICKQCSLALPANGLPSTVSTDPNCKLCQLMIDCGSAKEGDQLKMSYEKDSFSPIGELWTTFAGHSYRHPLRTMARKSPAAGQDLCPQICRSTELLANNHIADWHEALQHIGCLNDGDTGSAAAIAIVSYWLQTCVRSHRQCRHKQSSQYSPRRVIDLGNSENVGMLRLLQDVELDGPYVALSHRWGCEGLPSTTTANVADRLHNINLDELSRTMIDAIDIVRKLKFRYLWIDALCIVQNSTEDWLKEASHMSEVFSGAVVTIAVADADNHNQGIFRPRSVRCTRPFPIPFLRDMPYRERTQFDDEQDYYVFQSKDNMGTGNRPKGILDTRAWILQEQLLSPRILYFDRSEIFWDCITTSASESSPTSASLLENQNPDETWALKLLRKTLAQSTTIDTLRQRIADVWTQIIQNYSSRELSRRADKLVALQGVLQPLAILLKEDHVAGMWSGQLWKQLIWWTAKPSEFATTSSKRDFTAPSWSWLKMNGPVYYHNAIHGQDFRRDSGGYKFMELEQFARVLSVETDASPDPTSIRGSLTVSGQSFEYRLTMNDLKPLGVKSWNAKKWKLNTGVWMLDRELQLPVDIQCVIMAEDTVAKMLICLCLVRVEVHCEKWARIGLCHWDGLAWQVGKYVSKEPEDRTFVII